MEAELDREKGDVRQMRKKWKDCRGETLVEVLASILIASLSVALLFGGIMASSAIGRSAQSLDETYYEALSNAEERTGDTEPQEVTVSRGGVSTTITGVQRYGGEGIYAYAKGGGSGL